MFIHQMTSPPKPLPWAQQKPVLGWADPTIIEAINNLPFIKEEQLKRKEQSKHKYLGEFPVDIRKHPVYKKFKDRDWALYYIESYGQIDGDHHKTWVLDQCARILNGTPVIITEARWDNGEKEIRVVTGEPSTKYLQWREMMQGATYTDGPFEGCREYEYDEGISP